MAINEFTVLQCDCKGDLFIPVVRLKYKAEGGTITEPAGHKCAACGAIVDNRYMIRLIDIQKKRTEATRLQAEAAIEEQQMKQPPKGPVPAGRS